MRLSLLALVLAALFVLTACDRPEQALPEQEKANFEKVMSEEAAKKD